MLNSLIHDHNSGHIINLVLGYLYASRPVANPPFWLQKHCDLSLFYWVLTLLNTLVPTNNKRKPMTIRAFPVLSGTIGLQFNSKHCTAPFGGLGSSKCALGKHGW